MDIAAIVFLLIVGAILGGLGAGMLVLWLGLRYSPPPEAVIHLRMAEPQDDLDRLVHQIESLGVWRRESR